MIRALAWLLLAIAVAAPSVHAQPAGTGSPAYETVWIPMADGRQAIRLEATLYRPAGSSPFPVVVFNHGSTGPGAVSPKTTFRYAMQARYFVDRGFAVLIPMRRGRGASGGEYLETYGCTPSRLWPGIERGIEDLDAVLDFVRRQSWADPSRLVMGGQSRGGILSVAYAGRRPDVLKGVVNFAGGWTGEGCDQHGSFNAQVFREAGRSARVPMLWLYADYDRYYAPAAIRSYHAAFVEAGGVAAFRLFGDVGGDGHRLGDKPDVWSATADDYLRARGLLPNAGR